MQGPQQRPTAPPGLGRAHISVFPKGLRAQLVPAAQRVTDCILMSVTALPNTVILMHWVWSQCCLSLHYGGPAGASCLTAEIHMPLNSQGHCRSQCSAHSVSAVPTPPCATPGVYGRVPIYTLRDHSRSPSDAIIVTLHSIPCIMTSYISHAPIW